MLKTQGGVLRTFTILSGKLQMLKNQWGSFGHLRRTPQKREGTDAQKSVGEFCAPVLLPVNLREFTEVWINNSRFAAWPV
ncbi:MAG: hypothetical protein WD669_11790 [Pirellulales bacterium]